MVKENSIPQQFYKSNPLNQGGATAKIVDSTVTLGTDAVAYEFPPIWNDFFEEVAGNAKILP